MDNLINKFDELEQIQDEPIRKLLINRLIDVIIKNDLYDTKGLRELKNGLLSYNLVGLTDLIYNLLDNSDERSKLNELYHCILSDNGFNLTLWFSRMHNLPVFLQQNRRFIYDILNQTIQVPKNSPFKLFFNSTSNDSKLLCDHILKTSNVELQLIIDFINDLEWTN